MKEAPGYAMNVELYEWVRTFHLLTEKQIEPALSCLAYAMDTWGTKGPRKYWANYGKAILEWLELFKPEEAFGI